MASGENFKAVLGSFLQHYHSTPHSLTEKTPAELFLGRKIRTVLDLIREDTEGKIEQSQAQTREKGPQGNRAFDEGDNIYYQTNNPLNRDAPNFSPEIVMPREAGKTYKISGNNGDIIFRHEDHLKGRPLPVVDVTIPIALLPQSSSSTPASTLRSSAPTAGSSTQGGNSFGQPQRFREPLKCFGCGELGHYRMQCPHVRR